MQTLRSVGTTKVKVFFIINTLKLVLPVVSLIDGEFLLYICSMRIVADRDIPFLEGVLEPFGEVVYLAGSEIGPGDVAEADALLVRTRTKCGPELLGGSKVKFIGTATIGYDHIDMEWCAEQGIEVATAAGCNARGVLQWVAAALAWAGTPAAINFDPNETTLGVVGVGNVGRLVAEYAEEWGFRVMRCDPPREAAEGPEGFYSLEEVAAKADIVTFHVPLVDGGANPTRGMVGREFLGALKPGTVVINSSRGGVVDEEALKKAMGLGRPNAEGPHAREQKIRFILDVWNGEPGVDEEVLEQVLLGTPHIAGYTEEGKGMATAMVVRALAARFGLEPGSSEAGELWYPEGVRRSKPKKIGWEEMCERIGEFFDIEAESEALKAEPGKFEEMRNAYRYRKEFF